MAIDNRYGSVTVERGDIPDDEPVVLFRAQDALLPRILAFYGDLCMGAGADRQHVASITEAITRVVAWQKENPTKIPGTA